MLRRASTKGGRKERPSLAGTNLDVDPRTGIYLWRRKHPITKRRLKRSTGTRTLRIALARAQQFERELQRELVGLSKFDGYGRPPGPFVEPFLKSTRGAERRRKVLRMQLHRTFEHLHIKRLGDLENFITIERKLLALEGIGPGRFRRKTLAKGFQVPIKQFSSYLASRREILADHLAPWKSIKTDGPTRERRALLPEEMARALAASDCLDAICHRENTMRPVWTALLIVAPRVSAFAELDVEDLDHEKKRLLLKGNGNKGPGAGALDDATYQEIVEYIGDRQGGPLFLSPTGFRLDTHRSLTQWRANVSLAAVDMEWPDDQPRDLLLEYLVHLTLAGKRVKIALGGPMTGKSRPGPMKLAERNRKAALVGGIADGIRDAWQERMRGVDQHALRMTHQSWSLLAGVPDILIDRQLGHTTPGGEAALNAAWSLVGRRHYTDLNFLAMDAKRSADAVRDMLDRAETELAEIAARGESALTSGDGRGRAAAVCK